MVQEIQAGCEPDQIAPRLEQRFQSSDGTIRRDVEAFLGELQAKGLVEG